MDVFNIGFAILAGRNEDEAREDYFDWLYKDEMNQMWDGFLRYYPREGITITISQLLDIAEA